MFSDLTKRISESLTDVQWNILQSRVVYGDTFNTIGANLGLANAIVRQRQSKTLDEIIKLFPEEIKCFSTKLEKLLMDTGGTLAVKKCLVAFSEISEAEFYILFMASQKNREGIFHRSKELISVKSIFIR